MSVISGHRFEVRTFKFSYSLQFKYSFSSGKFGYSFSSSALAYICFLRLLVLYIL